jgi:histidine kinase
MSTMNQLRRHLGVKLFLSYLAVILIGIVVLAVAVEVAIPSAFQRHMVGMQGMMGGMMGGTEMDMFDNFRAGVNESLAIAAFAALVVALVASIFISRRVVAPLQELTHASQRIAEGRFEQRVVVSGDDPQIMDELAQLGQAFNQMAERLEHTEQMRRQLLADVSHELRTPLTAIKGSMEALVDGVLPAVPATFEQIEQEADRLQRLVNDLQELSRVEAGAYELELQPIAIETLVQTAVRRMESQFQRKGISLSVSLAPDLPASQGDPDRLLQVLINLLSNACQYTSAGGDVRVQADKRGEEILVSVTDNGIGIPPEHISHLFTRFYRVDKSRSRQAGGGSGIGLTIARHLIEAHGGRIWAESPGLGQGSMFAFTLPVQR